MAPFVDRGFTLWFTGLPCSGKSTLAARMAALFRAEERRVELLDGDLVRKSLSSDLGFSREDRDAQVRRVGWVAHLLCRNGVVAIVSLVSPYRAARENNRNLIRDYVEVYVRCPLEVCIQRDCKGMYRQALEGKIQRFTGISDPYEEPLHAELVVDASQLSEEECTDRIQMRLAELGYLSAFRARTVP